MAVSHNAVWVRLGQLGFTLKKLIKYRERNEVQRWLFGRELEKFNGQPVFYRRRPTRQTGCHAGGELAFAKLKARLRQQAVRELLLAQASDWPFILRSGTHADYARQRVENHLLAFNRLHKQLLAGRINAAALTKLEATDKIFPDVDHRYWA